MQYLLHIDTSTDVCGISISADGLLVAHRANAANRNHAATINIIINEVLAEAGISLSEISAFVVCAGPGSYTGLRIGLATAKGFCYALNKPLLLDNRLTLLAWQAYTRYKASVTQYVTLLRARDKEYFITIHNNNFECILPPQHITDEQLPGLVAKNMVTHVHTDVAGVAGTIDSKATEDNNISIDHNLWVSYAFSQFKSNNIVNLSTAEPFYLKQVYTHK